MADLDSLGVITHKKMFGGIGIFGNGKMFVIIDANGRVFLKGDPELAQAYEAEGRERHGMPYWSVTDTDIEDPDVFLVLARPAFALATVG